MHFVYVHSLLVQALGNPGLDACLEALDVNTSVRVM